MSDYQSYTAKEGQVRVPRDPGGGGGGAVNSVFGRTGSVTAASGDYDSTQVTNNSTVSGATVTDALDALQSVVPVDRAFVYHVGKHGDDTNSGLTPDMAFETIGAAINAILVNPIYILGAPFAIEIRDAGIYPESFSLPEFVALNAPNASVFGRLSSIGLTQLRLANLRPLNPGSVPVLDLVGSVTPNHGHDIEIGTIGLSGLPGDTSPSVIRCASSTGPNTQVIKIKSRHIFSSTTAPAVAVDNGDVVYLDCERIEGNSGVVVANGTAHLRVADITATTAYDTTGASANIVGFIGKVTGTQDPTAAGTTDITIAGDGGVTDLNGLSDVTLTAPTTGQYMQRDAGGQWVNVSVSPGGVAGSGTAGRVAYWDGASSISDDSLFLWDETNNRLSVGAAPAQSGSIALGFNDRVMWRNSSNGSDYGFGFGTSNRWVFDQNDASDTSVDITTNTPTTTPGGTTFNISDTGSGTASLRIEGWIEAHEANNFGGVAQSGSYRMRNNTSVSWRDLSNGDDIGVRVDNANRWSFDPSTVNTIHFVNSQTTTTPGGTSFDFSDTGSGTARMRVEGWVEAHESNNFGGVAQSGSWRTRNNQSISWRNVSNGDDMGLRVTNANFWSIDPQTGTNIITIVSGSTTTTPGGTEFRFADTGSGTAKVKVEGWLELHDGNNFPGNIAQSGVVRIPNNRAFVARDVSNGADLEMLRMTNTNRLQLAGAADWPSSNAAGVVSNDGAGDLSYYQGAAISNPAADVNSLQTTLIAVLDTLRAANIIS